MPVDGRGQLDCARRCPPCASAPHHPPRPASASPPHRRACPNSSSTWMSSRATELRSASPSSPIRSTTCCTSTKATTTAPTAHSGIATSRSTRPASPQAGRSCASPRCTRIRVRRPPSRACERLSVAPDGAPESMGGRVDAGSVRGRVGAGSVWGQCGVGAVRGRCGRTSHPAESRAFPDGSRTMRRMTRAAVAARAFIRPKPRACPPITAMCDG